MSIQGLLEKHRKCLTIGIQIGNVGFALLINTKKQSKDWLEKSMDSFD